MGLIQPKAIDMVSEKFRRQLLQEASQWQSESLISPDVFRQLADRYNFDTLDDNARDRFVAILIIVGSVLLGIGVITFVAANWQSIPRPAKVMLLLAVLMGVNAAGFYLWRSPVHAVTQRLHWRNRLGHGFLICGAIVLGSNLALLGQMFHQAGSAFGLCLIWGFGVVAMAYGLRLTSLAALACVLVNIGYWIELSSYSIRSFPLPLTLVFDFMPIVLGVVFLPLAYWCQSRLVFGLTVIGVSASLASSMFAPLDYQQDPFGLTVAIALTLPVAFWWAYDDEIWSFLQSRHSAAAERQPGTPSRQDGEEQDWRFRPVGRSLAVVYLGYLFYTLSFHSAWNDYQWGNPPEAATLAQVVNALVTNLNVVVIAVLALVFWLRLGWPRIGRTWRLTSTDGVILVMSAITAGMVIWNAAIDPIQVGATMVFNSLLFLISAGLMREGLADGDRRQFWFGLVLLILQILSRVFEYETGLLLKSMTFLLCGVAIIIIGLWFERYVRTFTSHSSSP